MYQATAIKLNTERQYLSEEISEAKTSTRRIRAQYCEASCTRQPVRSDTEPNRISGFRGPYRALQFTRGLAAPFLTFV